MEVARRGHRDGPGADLGAARRGTIDQVPEPELPARVGAAREELAVDGDEQRVRAPTRDRDHREVQRPCVGAAQPSVGARRRALGAQLGPPGGLRTGALEPVLQRVPAAIAELPGVVVASREHAPRSCAHDRVVRTAFQRCDWLPPFDVARRHRVLLPRTWFGQTSALPELVVSHDPKPTFEHKLCVPIIQLPRFLPLGSVAGTRRNFCQIWGTPCAMG